MVTFGVGIERKKNRLHVPILLVFLTRRGAAGAFRGP